MKKFLLANLQSGGIASTDKRFIDDETKFCWCFWKHIFSIYYFNYGIVFYANLTSFISSRESHLDKRSDGDCGARAFVRLHNRQRPSVELSKSSEHSSGVSLSYVTVAWAQLYLELSSAHSNTPQHFMNLPRNLEKSSKGKNPFEKWKVVHLHSTQKEKLMKWWDMKLHLLRWSGIKKKFPIK